MLGPPMRPLVPLLLALAVGEPAHAQEDSALPVASAAPPRALAPTTWHAQAGLLVNGYSHGAGRWSEAFLAASASGHLLLGGLTLDGGLLSLLPAETGGPGGSLALSARVGYTGERWSVVAGPVVHLAPSASPALQVLPSVKGRVRAGPLMLDAGLFDLHGLIPAHVGAEWGNYGLGYVLPLGARAHARLPLTARTGLRVEGFAFRLGNAHAAMLTVGVVGHPSSARAPGVTP